MRLALLEPEINWENKEKNISRLDRELDILQSRNIDIVFLPEMSFTGFSMNVAVTQDYGNETIDRMKEFSCRHGIRIAFGWVNGGRTGCRNHYSIVNNDKLEMDYEKIHPFSYGGESQIFSGGESLSVARIKDFVIGVQICYDLRFPETFQILSKRASMIVVPANWPGKRETHWDTLLRARSIENQVYLAGINCRGKIGGLEYMGHSALYSPDGSLMESEAIVLEEGTHVYLYDIRNDVEEYRSSFPVKQDRREHLYRELMVKSGV